MNKFTKIIVFGVASVFVFFDAFSCCNCTCGMSNPIDGSRNVIRKTRKVQNFHKIEFNLVASVEITQGEAESVKIETDDNIIPAIQTIVSKGTLKIQTAKRKCFTNSSKLKIRITVKDLDVVKHLGAGDIKIKNLKTSKFKVILNGAGSVNVQKLNADVLVAHLTGAGSLNINSGSASKQKISILGCGSFNGEKLVGDKGKVSITGCGVAKVNIQDLTLMKTGVGSVENFAV